MTFLGLTLNDLLAIAAALVLVLGVRALDRFLARREEHR